MINEEGRKSTGSLPGSFKSASSKKMSRVRKVMSLRSLGEGLKGVLNALPSNSKREKEKEKAGGVVL